MGVSLSKGGNVSLTKEAPGLTNVVIGLGWDVRSTDGADFDLDASAIIMPAPTQTSSGIDSQMLRERLTHISAAPNTSVAAVMTRLSPSTLGREASQSAPATAPAPAAAIKKPRVVASPPSVFVATTGMSMV